MSKLLGPVRCVTILTLLSVQPLRADEPVARPNALPAGAVTRFGTSRFLNFGRVFSLAFSRDGTMLAAGSWDGTVRIWEVASGKELHQFQDQKGPVRSVAFSPGGKIFASTAERSGVVLRDTIKGTEIRRLVGKLGPITHVQFSPDDKLLALKGYAPTLHLWDVASGREVRQLVSQDPSKPRSDPECPISFALDAKTVASATLTTDEMFQSQRAFRFWDVLTGSEVRSFKVDSFSYGAVAFSPDNKLLARVAGLGRQLTHRICLWDMGSGNALPSIESAQIEQSDSLSSLAFSPDGKTLTSSSGGVIQIWEVATRQELCRFANPDAGPAPVVFSPDGRLLASGGTDITVLMWDVTGQMENGKLPPTQLSPQDLQSLWSELSTEDGSKARKTIWTFVTGDGASVAFLRDRLHPVATTTSAETIARLVADLDSPQFAVRKSARDELAALAELAEPALLVAKENHPSLEQRQRIDQLLKLVVDRRSRPSGDRLRALRAVGILEQIATREARQVLQTLTRGAAGALLTGEAQAALTRLER